MASVLLLEYLTASNPLNMDKSMPTRDKDYTQLVSGFLILQSDIY